MTTALALDHEPFCLPRPGSDEPRIETYRADRTDETGLVIGRASVTRCIECGAQEVRG